MTGYKGSFVNALHKHSKAFWIEICQDNILGLEEVRNSIFTNSLILYLFVAAFRCTFLSSFVCQFVFSDFGRRFLRPFLLQRFINSLLRAPILSTMGFKFLTHCITVASIFFSLSSCAPLKLQENEDPDIYRNVVR